MRDEPVLIWPAWHDDEFLTESHMLGLERVFQARLGMAEGSSLFDGIEQFDAARSLGAELVAPGLLRVTIGNTDQAVGRAGDPSEQPCLEGVAPDGAPVIVQDGPLRADYHFDLSHTSLIFDLSVEVNPRREGGLDPPPKFALRVQPAGDVELMARARRADWLFLGRFGWAAAQPVVLTCRGRPRVRRLAALRPVSDDPSGWDTWVAPLRNRIQELLKQSEEDPKTHSIATRTYAAELARLDFEWPILPIPILARRLLMVQWMRARTRGHRISPLPLALRDLRSLLQRTGDGLPEALRDLLELPSDIDKDEFQPLNHDAKLDDGPDARYFPEPDGRLIPGPDGRLLITFHHPFPPGLFLLGVPGTANLPSGLRFECPERGIRGWITSPAAGSRRALPEEQRGNKEEPRTEYLVYEVRDDQRNPVYPLAQEETWEIVIPAEVTRARLWYREDRR
jgi:hypothetical protein